MFLVFSGSLQYMIHWSYVNKITGFFPSLQKSALIKFSVCKCEMVNLFKMEGWDY